ncbi:Golgi apparatus membrane protein TVP23 A [Cichlidogyrus casuarinus]|uniref:Golgi apparatus membrane protein TVP23 homolog n=1 Tax=Cichlidogyrus casuarinus TaxID=1844966 RepID=A0ABD2Q580_9PLAT
MNSQQDEVVLTLTEDLDDDNFGEEGRTKFKPSERRMVVVAHYIFRLAALFIYLFSTWFTSAFVVPFVLVTLCLAIDFWITKNISGRILVGLRWWNFIDKQGNSQWVFESRPISANMNANSPFTMTKRQLAEQHSIANQARLFWIGLAVSIVSWFIFILTALFSLKLKWALLSILAFCMNGANLYGYLRCRFKNNELSRISMMGSMVKQLFRGAATPAPSANVMQT